MNWGIAFLATGFWFIESRYFGFNLRAESEAELICDGMVILMFILAIGFRDKTPTSVRLEEELKTVELESRIKTAKGVVI